MTEQPARAESLPMTQLQQQQQQRPLPLIALNDGVSEWRMQPMQQQQQQQQRQGNDSQSDSPRKSPHRREPQQSARERRDDHSNHTSKKQQPPQDAELAAETRKEEERARNAHKWADKLCFLPEALVIPKALRLKAAEDDLEAARNGEPVSPGNRALKLRQARVDFLRRLFAELVGTTVLVASHSILRMKAHEKTILEDGCALFAGLTLVLLIYALGEISGAHFNPCVTTAFCVRRIFPWRWLPLYWLAQFIGALCGGALVRGFFGQDRAYFGTSYVDPASRFTDVSGMMFEAMLTFFLLLTILGVATRGGIVGLHAALAVGSVIGMNVALGAGLTGGSMNPFRSIGPGLISGPRSSLWPFVAGPFIGTAIALVVVGVLAGHSTKGARKAAMGSGKEVS